MTSKVLNNKGWRKGLTYNSRDIPANYLSEIDWVRVVAPLCGTDAESNSPFVSIPSVYFWAPVKTEKSVAVTLTKCFDSNNWLFCPADGAFLGKAKLYKKNIDVLVGCPTCGIRWRPVLDGKTEIAWYTIRGELMGHNNVFPVFEFPP